MRDQTKLFLSTFLIFSANLACLIFFIIFFIKLLSGDLIMTTIEISIYVIISFFGCFLPFIYREPITKEGLKIMKNQKIK